MLIKDTTRSSVAHVFLHFLTVLADTSKLYVQLGNLSDFATADKTIDSEFLVRPQRKRDRFFRIKQAKAARSRCITCIPYGDISIIFQGSAIYLKTVISLRYFAVMQVRSGHPELMCQAVGICCLKIPSHAILISSRAVSHEPRDEISHFTLYRSSGL
jgi:hypothetical protein